MIFRQRGVSYRYAVMLLIYLDYKLLDLCKGRARPIPCPTRWTDLAPKIYFLWKNLNELMYPELHTTMKKLKNQITQITQHTGKSKL